MIVSTSSVPQQKSPFTSKFHYAEIGGPQKMFEADLNPQSYDLQDGFQSTFQFDTLTLSYFIFTIRCQIENWQESLKSLIGCCENNLAAL